MESNFRWLPSGEHERWSDFALASGAGPFAGPAWLQAMEEAGIETALAVCEREGRIVAGALFRILHRPGLRLLLPAPLAPYQGPWLLPRGVAEPDREERHAAETLRVLARGLAQGFDRIQMILPPEQVDARPFLWEGWDSRARYTCLLDLSKPLDPNRAVVKQVRKAREAGLGVWPSTDWLLLHALWAESLGNQGVALPLGEAAFAACCRRLAGHGLLHLWISGPSEGEAWFANAVLVEGDRAYDWVAGASRDQAPSGGNQLLKTTICEALGSRGVSCFDLVGGDHPGIAAYKRSLGARLQIHVEVSRNVSWKARLLAACGAF